MEWVYLEIVNSDIWQRGFGLQLGGWGTGFLTCTAGAPAGTGDPGPVSADRRAGLAERSVSHSKPLPGAGAPPGLLAVTFCHWGRWARSSHRLAFPWLDHFLGAYNITESQLVPQLGGVRAKLSMNNGERDTLISPPRTSYLIRSPCVATGSLLIPTVRGWGEGRKVG